MALPADIALIYDPEMRRCDVALSGRDVALDTTPRTAMLVSLGLERRARPNDALPDVAGDPATPASLELRRGTPLDALDGQGRMTGSRLWLLVRAKQTETTRRQAADYATEALAWLEDARGLAATVSAEWLRPGVLALTCRADDATVTIQRAVA